MIARHLTIWKSLKTALQLIDRVRSSAGRAFTRPAAISIRAAAATSACTLLFCVLAQAGANDLATAELHGARLLLSDGHVVEIDASGQIPDQSPMRLDLGSSDASIFAVAVDIRFDRLYVTAESDYARRATRVFRLSSLQPMGLLPGVTKVVIPSRPEAETIAAFRYERADSTQASPGLQELHENSVASVSIRSRSNPAEVIARSNDWRVPWARFECQISNEIGFYAAQLGQVVDPHLEMQADRRLAALANAASTVMGCWPDGTLLLFSEREPRSEEPIVGEIVLMNRRLEPTRQLTVDASFRIDQIRLVELGESAGTLVVLKRQAERGSDIIGSSFNFETGNETALHLPSLASFGGEAYGLSPAGLSVDRQSSFLVPTRNLAGGLLLKRLDRLFAVSSRDPSQLRELNVPDALLRINRANKIRLDPTLDSDTRARLLSDLPPIASPLTNIREVQIVHVLPGPAGRMVERPEPRSDR